MPSSCEILFDEPNTNGIYRSGHVLNGKVKLVTTSEKTVRGIHITINGTGKVAWDNRRRPKWDGKKMVDARACTSHENYLSSKTFVFGTEGGGTYSLPPGIHAYTFSAFLPRQLPSSFIGKYGQVNYEVVVTIDRPLRFDTVFRQAFTVIQSLDLNLNPAHSQPKEVEVEKYFFCCCWASGCVKAKLSIPFRGFTPGQKLPYTLLVDNETNNDVGACKIKITQRVTYTSRKPYKQTRYKDQLISSDTLAGPIRFSKKKIDKEFQIPPLPPSTRFDDAIIKIEYFLIAIIETGAFHLNDTLTIPIVIGTVPLYAHITNPNIVITAQPRTQPEFIESGNALPPYESIAVPPSFEDATGIQD